MHASLTLDRRFRGPAVAAAVISLVALDLAAMLWLARIELRQGLADVRAARASVTAPDALRHHATRSEVRRRLISARTSFLYARMLLWLPGPLLAHAGWVPRFGGEMAAAAPAADTGYYAAGAALHLDAGLEPVLSAAVRRRGDRRPVLQRLAPALSRERPEFAAAQADARRAVQALAATPTTGIPALDRQKARMQPQLRHLLQAATLLDIAPALLGSSGTSTYLFVWEDPMELRATGGFIGASDLITVHRGAMTHRFAGRVPAGREITTALLPLPEAAYTPETYWIFCDSNWSPSFPLSARLERWFYGEDTGLWAQGVIDFVDTSISDILRATGPIYLPAYHRMLTAGNATALAQRYINGSYKGPMQSGPSDTVRKQFFHHVMLAIERRIQTLPPSRWLALGSALARIVDHGGLLLYDRRPDVEAAIASLGADGRLLDPHGDYLYVVDDNRSYNKVNPYVRERIGHVTTVLPTLWQRETLTIRYHVNPSPANLRGYGPGLGRLSLRQGYGPSLGPIGSKHDYQDFLRVYVPAGSVLEHMSGISAWASQPAYGRTQFAGQVFVREGRSVTVRITYRVPPRSGAGRYRLAVQHQPGSRIGALRLVVREPGRGTIRQVTIREPQSDVRLSAPLRGPFHPAPMRLAPALQADPYIPYRSLFDPRHAL